MPGFIESFSHSKLNERWHQLSTKQKALIIFSYAVIASNILAAIGLRLNDYIAVFSPVVRHLIWSAINFIGLISFGYFFNVVSRLLLIATEDHLTGLKTVRYLENVTDTILARLNRTGETFTLYNMDIDEFKKINDAYGHHVGDEVLKLVAQTLNGISQREDDVKVRVGGDEFYLGGFSGDEEGPAKFYKKLKLAFTNLNCVIGNLVVPISVSVGFKTLNKASVKRKLNHHDFNNLRVKSDKEMYDDKEKTKENQHS